MRSLYCALLVACLSTAVYGQEFTGHVKDASGAAVAGATITIHHRQECRIAADRCPCRHKYPERQ
jgi:hypothetical protein